MKFTGRLKVLNSQRALVLAPIVTLSLIFMTIQGGMLAYIGPLSATAYALMAAAALIYIGTFLWFARQGMANLGRLEQVGLTDSLCLLPNRRALHRDARRYGADTGMALALIDLDAFKLVNDNYGREIGDRVLKEFAELLKQYSGTDARCYRLGGDEFVILVMGDIAGNIAEGICRILLSRLAKPLAIDDRLIVLGASIGMAQCTASARLTSSELLRRCDVAMYASKVAGKMRCTWFNLKFDQNREAIQEIETELRLAMDNDEFRLHYQPLVDASSGTVVAAEALLRWERSDGKRIGPDIFIPIAEESGLINPIGTWVLRQACIDALGWGGIVVSVNVSAAQLRNPEFPIDLGHILEETGFPAHRLELELTETYLVHDPVVAARNLEVIRSFGIRIVLDDFGTGYASIGFLRQFNFEKLKLDRSLVVDAEKDSSSKAMMVASIAVARALDMDVTAEGVETEAQAELVRSVGCDQIQGWLYYKAMPAADLDRHFANQVSVIEFPKRKLANPA